MARLPGRLRSWCLPKIDSHSHLRAFLGHVGTICFQVHVIVGRIQFLIGHQTEDLNFLLAAGQRSPSALWHLVLFNPQLTTQWLPSFFISLGYICFTMLCYFLLCNEVNQPYLHITLPSWTSLPPHHPVPPF